MVDESDKYEEEIVWSDDYIIKSEIWTSWYGFLSDFSALVMYNQASKVSGKTYLSAIRNFNELYNKIGESLLEKWLDKEKYAELTAIYIKTIKGTKININEFEQIKQITNLWLSKSGMGDIKKANFNPFKAVRYNR